MPDGQKLPHLKVHPHADVYPLISDDELLKLAEDMAQNGFRPEYPIMLDHSGEILVDGRNRYRAAAMAQVEPRFERLPEGTDLVAYIVSANIKRRHMNKGQQAIALALAYPEKRPGHRTDLFGKGTGSEKIARSTLSEAREIVAHADLPPLVMASGDGALSFDAALAEARFRVQNAGLMAERMRELQNDAPDLADKVAEGKWRFYQAWAEMERRQRAANADLRQQSEQFIHHLQHFLALWSPRLLKDERFRAGLIHALKVEPDQVGPVLDALDQLAKVTAHA